MLPLLVGACFPTMHNARIEPGRRVGVSLTRLNDQERGARPQGHDYLTIVDLAYGLGNRVEIGTPFGVYWEEGLGNWREPHEDASFPIFSPYVKVALLPDTSRHHLAVFGQAALVVPASFGIRYGIEQAGWEPHIGLTWILSAGPPGDSPAVTRYQQEDQFLYVVSAGVTWLGRREAALEAGVLSNRYPDGSRARYSRIATSLTRRTFYDFFITVRFALSPH